MMSSSIENHSPEVSGLLAAKSGFGLVEGAFVPASRRIAPAALWLIAAIGVATLAATAGVRATADAPAMAAQEAMPAAPDPVVATPQPARTSIVAVEERVAPAKHTRVLPVVLRGQPSRAGTGS